MYRKILGIKKIGGGEHQQVLPKIFCLIVPIISSGNPFVLCAVFQKFARAKKFREKKGQYQDYPSNNFSLTVPKIFVGQTC